MIPNSRSVVNFCWEWVIYNIKILSLRKNNPEYPEIILKLITFALYIPCQSVDVEEETTHAKQALGEYQEILHEIIQLKNFQTSNHWKRLANIIEGKKRMFLVAISQAVIFFEMSNMIIQKYWDFMEYYF
jgi:hypothetical protein